MIVVGVLVVGGIIIAILFKKGNDTLVAMIGDKDDEDWEDM